MYDQIVVNGNDTWRQRSNPYKHATAVTYKRVGVRLMANLAELEQHHKWGVTVGTHTIDGCQQCQEQQFIARQINYLSDLFNSIGK